MGRVGRDRCDGGSRPGAEQSARHAPTTAAVGANAIRARTIFSREGHVHAEFHTYAVEWEPGEIRWLVDGKEYQKQSFWWSTSKTEGAKGRKPANEADLNAWPAPFDQPFYLVMNVAVGGNFLGNPDRTTQFPAEMVVDYVRVYEKVGGYGKTRPRGDGKLPF
ncbi:MAG: glycoside hydrolase family 16 protein [Gemmataceae bacterium]